MPPEPEFLEVETLYIGNPGSFRTGYHFHDVRDAVALVNVNRQVKYGEPISDNFFKKPFKIDRKP